MKKKLFIIILLIMFLSACELIDTESMTETNSPSLLSSPINGVWEVSNIIKSDNRFSYKLKDQFIFNIDLVASDDNLYLSPEYEVHYVSWRRYLEEKERWIDVAELLQKEYVNMIQIRSDDQIVAEIVPISDNLAIGIMNNQMIELRRIKETISKDEKNDIILKFSEKEKQNKSDNTWGFALGLKEFKYDAVNNLPKYDYYTLLFYYSPMGLKVESLDGILINYKGQLDHYKVERETEGSFIKDRIYLNGTERPILDHDKNFQSNIFTINYLSSNYLTLEYYQGYKNTLNTLSTYSSKTKKGFAQLKSDDLISFSSDKILETLNKTGSDLAFEDAIYNIGITRENGIAVLKGRLITEKEKEPLVRDYLLSTSFMDPRVDKSKLDYFEELKRTFPNIIDFYLTPNQSHVIIIRGDNISIYKAEGNKLIYSQDINPNNKTISGSSIGATEMESIRAKYQQYFRR